MAGFRRTLRVTQSGFSWVLTTALILVILLAVLVAAIGWRVYSGRQDDHRSSQGSSTGRLEMPGASGRSANPADKASSGDGIVNAVLSYCRNQGVADQQLTRAEVQRTMQDESRFVQSGGFVRLSMSCAADQGEFRLYLQERPDGSWANLGATQDPLPGCSMLDGLNVPAAIAQECMGRNGQKRPIQ